MIIILSRAILHILSGMAFMVDVMVAVPIGLILVMMIHICVTNGRTTEINLLNGMLLIIMSVAVNAWQLIKIYYAVEIRSMHQINVVYCLRH